MIVATKIYISIHLKILAIPKIIDKITPASVNLSKEPWWNQWGRNPLNGKKSTLSQLGTIVGLTLPKNMVYANLNQWGITL